jgi:hypothetical protein
VEPRPLIGLLSQPWLIDGDDCVAVGEKNDRQEKLKYSYKTCASASLSITNPTLLDPGSNPDRRCEKPPTERMRYAAA